MSKQRLSVAAPSDGTCCAPEPAGTAECCAPLASEPLSDAAAEDLAPLFKAVADPMRLRLLSLIACHEGGESCVCDLTAAFDVTAPTVSYHLRILREAGLISAERRGTWVYYRVNPPVMARMSAVLVPAAAYGLQGAAGLRLPALGCRGRYRWRQDLRTGPRVSVSSGRVTPTASR